MKEDFEFVRDYTEFKIGDTVREPYSGYVAKIRKKDFNIYGEQVYYLEDMAGYFVREELELIKEKALN